MKSMFDSPLSSQDPARIDRARRRSTTLIRRVFLVFTAVALPRSIAYQSPLLPFRNPSTLTQKHDRNDIRTKFDFSMQNGESMQMLFLCTSRKSTYLPTKLTTMMSSQHRIRRRRSRGVLGFQITTIDPSHLESPVPRHASISNVDTMAWNLPEPLQSEDMLPWIPSTEEIEKLTVVQLKKELGMRALKKVGNKYHLQNRLKEWTHDNEQDNGDSVSPLSQQQDTPLSMNSEDDRMQVDSLQEWARTVDLEPLLQRREEIHREKQFGPKRVSKRIPSQWPSDVRSVIQKMFDQPSSIYSNFEVQQMYRASKQADQMGNRALAKRILYELKSATPHDARIYRRLARMEMEDDQIDSARSILQEGIDLHPDNAFLWHGLGQLEGSIGNFTAQRQHWEMAMQVDPFVPHSYHALATCDHAAGRIASAMRILKLGLQYCPTNHRLHHALGDLYRDAKLLKMAQKCYHKAIEHGPKVSHGFGWTALAYVAYEEGHFEQCRTYLHTALRDEGRCANAWVALAQFEESVGNIAASRSAAQAGIEQYERLLLQRYNCTALKEPVPFRNALFRQKIPSFRSGDRFFNLFRNWLRLEMRYGNLETVENVYERAVSAFPREYKIHMDMAHHYQRLNLLNKARKVYAAACGTARAEPYRYRAELEMQQKNYEAAQQILYAGALTASQSRAGVPELFYAWALCEWHLGHFSHAEKLLDYVVARWNESLSPALIWYTRARMEWDREEPSLAQHFIGLSLKEESGLPGGSGPVWDLWSVVANAMGNERLAQQCREQATMAHAAGQQEETIHLSESRQWMRRDPWHAKILTPPRREHDFHRWLSLFPSSRVEETSASLVTLASSVGER